MDNSSWEEFESILNIVAWYGEVFKKAEGGTNWNNVGGISIYTTPWIDYYLHLKNGKFNNYCDELTKLNLGKGESDIVVERLSRLVKELDEFELTPGLVNVKASIEAYSVGNLTKGLDALLSEHITIDDFWINGETHKYVLLKVNNFSSRAKLKAAYKNIIHSLQSQEAEQIRILTAQVQKYEDLLKKLNAKLQLVKYEDKRNSEVLAQIKTEKKELYDQNTKLSKQVAELTANGYTNDEDDDLPDTTAFKMVLLYRLGLLDRSIWPTATRFQIGRVLGEIVGQEYKTATKYEEHLNNGTAKGQTMLENNDEKVEAFLKKSFKNFNLKKQKFIMHLEKKKE